jgi:hypothetical protein
VPLLMVLIVAFGAEVGWLAGAVVRRIAIARRS